MKHFSAPWGRGLKWASALSALLCIAIGATSLWHLPDMFAMRFAKLLALSVPLLAIPCALLFIVRGYSVRPGTLVVHRLLWDTTLDVSTLKSAEVVPDAIKGSLRTCGNGGMFSFTGRYWSKRLGHYRAFVNDWSTCIVIRCESKTYVLSTDDPQGLISALGTPP